MSIGHTEGRARSFSADSEFRTLLFLGEIFDLVGGTIASCVQPPKMSRLLEENTL
jgi:hypothetical protein